MRIDKFLKVSRLLKRRSVAASACDEARIFVGEKAVKPAYRVKVGDIITVVYGNRRLSVEVTALNEKATKDEAATLYRVCEESTDE